MNEVQYSSVVDSDRRFDNLCGSHLQMSKRVVSQQVMVRNSLVIDHLRESKTVLDSGFRIPGTGFQYLSVELGFWIPIVSGIPDSFSCIPDSKTQDSRFHRQNFPGFRIPQTKISRIPVSFTWGKREFKCC